MAISVKLKAIEQIWMGNQFVEVEVLEVSGFPQVAVSVQGDVQTVKLGKVYQLLGIRGKNDTGGSTDFGVIVGRKDTITKDDGINTIFRSVFKTNIDISCQWDFSPYQYTISELLYNDDDYDDTIYMRLSNEDGAKTIDNAVIELSVIPGSIESKGTTILQT